jgi:hypothetical protein
MSTRYGDGPVVSSGTSCQTITEWGRCQQTARHDGWCSYHRTTNATESFKHDAAYHKKIVLGLLQSSHDVLSEVEVDALFRGRTRNDGRRTDLYTVL